MPRLPEYDADQIVTAAGRLIAANGPGAATIGAIARAVGAPIGSIYHRFRSRDVLLAQVWLRAATAFQTEFVRRLAGSPPRQAGLAAALYMAQRVREKPREARLLLVHRREDFVDRGWPPGLSRQARGLACHIDDALEDFCRRLTGRAEARTVRIVTFAAVEAPFAAVRRHVAANESPPPIVDDLIRVTYEAVLGLLGSR
jgi:AcrR family transcriptional regulator